MSTPAPPDAAAVPRPVGMWRAIARGWALWVPAVVVGGLVQALLVLGDPVPLASAGFLALVALSVLVTTAGLWLISAAVAGGPAGRVGLRPALQRGRLLGWSLVVVLLLTATGVLYPLAVPVAAVVGAFLLAPSADGVGMTAAIRALAHRPVRYLLAAVLTAVLTVLAAVAALIAGFFVTGVVAAFATWLWFGATAVGIVGLWCSLLHRAVPLAPAAAAG